MKNLFKEQRHTGLYIGIGTAVVVAGVADYLMLTRDGNKKCDDIKEKTKDIAREIASAFISDKTGIRKETVRKAADQIG